MADATEHLRDLTQWSAISSLDPGRLLCGRVENDRVLVWRDSASLSAFSGTCPHLGGPLDEGIVVDGAIRCPWHHACFDLATGRSLSAPAFDPLPRYAVEVKDGRFAVRKATADPQAHAALASAGSPSDPMVIVGGGAAAFAAADALRRRGWQEQIIMFSEEGDEPYDRTLLTKDYLDGRFGDDRLSIARHSLSDMRIQFEGKSLVESIDPGQKALRLKGGRTQRYGKLLLATGAAARTFAVPGANLPHVLTLRSLADCRRLLLRLETRPRVVVVGGSFIAMEAAASLRSRGLSVAVVAPESHPMEKVFGRDLSDLILEVHRNKGVELHLDSRVARIDANAVALDGGKRIAADLVLLGVGVAPRAELAQAAGLKVEDGVCVNAQLQTSRDDILAAGDIARWPDPHSGESIRVEHWVVAQRQGQTAAATMLGFATAFEMVPFFWTKHFDLAIRYVGHAPNWDDVRIEGDLSRRNAAVHFRRKGRDLAVATVGRDEQSLEVELAMKRSPRAAPHTIGSDAA